MKSFSIDQPSSKIFISYRHEDSSAHAGRLRDALKKQFGDDSVFRDYDSVPAGVDFVDYIKDALRSCVIVLVVVGKSWANIKDKKGKLRLNNENDYVRFEVASALAQQKRVIPILVQDAEMPDKEYLPDCLKSLCNKNARELNEDDWDDDVRRLIEEMRGILKPSGFYRLRKPIFLSTSVLIILALVFVLSPLRERFKMLIQKSMSIPSKNAKAKLDVFERVPLSLENTALEKKTVFLEVRNENPGPIKVEIWRTVQDEQWFEKPEYRIGGFTVKPGKETKDLFLATMGLKLDLNRYDLPFDINPSIDFAVKLREGDPLYMITKAIRVYPRNYIIWDLKCPNGEPVDKKFLIASLATWTRMDWQIVMEEAKVITERAKLYASEHNLSSFEECWFQLCYKKCFEGSPPRLNIQQDTKDFPAKNPQVIFSPGEILKSGVATPLEATLLLSALARKPISRSMRIALFALPREENSSNKNFFFGWSKNGREWRALNLTEANNIEFESNREEATARLRRTITKRPELLESLQQKGVFADGLYVGLEFEVALNKLATWDICNGSNDE